MTTKTEKTFKKITDKLNNAKKNQDGFSFIEVIIVIAMILILTAILIPSYMGFVETAREANVKLSAQNMYTSIQVVSTKISDFESYEELYEELKLLNPSVVGVGASYDKEAMTFSVKDFDDPDVDAIKYLKLPDNSCAIGNITLGDNYGFTFDYYQSLNGKMYRVQFVNGQAETTEYCEVKSSIEESESGSEETDGDSSNTSTEEDFNPGF